jgi:hypothetical protein
MARPLCDTPLCFQSCDVVKLAIMHKKILAKFDYKRGYESRFLKKKPFNILSGKAHGLKLYPLYRYIHQCSSCDPYKWKLTHILQGSLQLGHQLMCSRGRVDPVAVMWLTGSKFPTRDNQVPKPNNNIMLLSPALQPKNTQQKIK